MAFSVEPGIYFPGRWGARIEDIVIVTDDGALSVNNRPHELIVVPVSLAAASAPPRRLAGCQSWISRCSRSASHATSPTLSCIPQHQRRHRRPRLSSSWSTGCPRACRRPRGGPSLQLPAPAGWPFGEEFPRTCGAGRLAGGALFWTDFLYDDHGATGLPVGDLKIQAPPRGTYIYPDGPAARNGADIFRVAIGLTETAHLVADRLEHTAGRLGADRAVHLRHRPRASGEPTSGPPGRACARRASTWRCWSRVAAPR